MCRLIECWDELREAEHELGPDVEIEVDQLAEGAGMLHSSQNAEDIPDNEIKEFIEDIFKENDNG